MTPTFAYRDPLEGARLRHAELCTRHSAEQGDLAAADAVRGRRVARVAAAAVGALGVAALVATVIGRAVAGLGLDGGAVTPVLLGAWPAMGVAYVVGRVDAWGRVAALGERLRPEADIFARIARLERRRPVEEARARAARLEQVSVALPLVALSLLAPLTVHFTVSALLGLRNFDVWIVLSLAIVGHAHLVLAWLSTRYARFLRTSDSDTVRRTWLRHATRVLGFTVLASAIPGVIFVLLPPIITAMTGLVVILPAFRAAACKIVAERVLLGEEA